MIADQDADLWTPRRASDCLDVEQSLALHTELPVASGECIDNVRRALVRYPERSWSRVFGYCGSRRYDTYRLSAHSWIWDWEHERVIDPTLPCWSTSVAWLVEREVYFAAVYDGLRCTECIAPSGRTRDMREAAQRGKAYGQAQNLIPRIRHWQRRGERTEGANEYVER